MTFKAIGKRIGKDQTTVSKEVKKRIDITPTAVKRTNGNIVKHGIILFYHTFLLNLTSTSLSNFYTAYHYGTYFENLRAFFSFTEKKQFKLLFL
jgi:hypothetical protein